MGIGFLKYVFILPMYFKLCYAEKSPCPEYFLFEPHKSEDDRWYGIITLKSTTNTEGISLELYFDKPVIQLGNSFGKVKANTDNTVFTITNNAQGLKANKPKEIEIYVVYDPTYDVLFPQLQRILLNGREICPHEQKEQIGNSPDVTININVPNCGIKTIRTTPLIVHGSNSREGDWPWHAALYVVKENKNLYICGGTLISEKHILTAAHCTTVGTPAVLRNSKDLAVVLGKYATYVFSKYEQNMEVSKIIVHPNFNRENLHNDISIIITINSAKVTDYVKPICLWEEDTDLANVVNRFGTVVGWGMDHKNNLITDILMEVQMPVIDTLKCIREVPGYITLTNDQTFCAGYRNGTSVCNGDSGGGLVFPKKGTTGVESVWQIRGIVSNALGAGAVCDPNYYAIFTDVAKYLDWIKINLNQ